MENNKNNNLLSSFHFPSGIEIKNRIVMAPMTTFSGHADGTVSDAELGYYKRRADGLGMIVTACAYVIPHGKGFSGQIGIHSDEMIPRLSMLASIIQENGAKAILQIYHGGRMSPATEVPGGIVLSASNVASLRDGAAIPVAMTEDQIQETIVAFGEATRRAIEAGFDGVEIHGANTYLLQQFFSPHSNRRTDCWGGDVNNRMTFPLAVVDEVTGAVKIHARKPFIVGYRISPEEVEVPGITIGDTLQLVDQLAVRKLDYLHVSTMNFWAPSMRDERDTKPRTLLISERVGERIPIIGVGGIQNKKDAQRLLDAGIPLVAMGRELLMEPDWGVKVQQNSDQLRFALELKSKHELAIPDLMWNALVAREGWVSIK